MHVSLTGPQLNQLLDSLKPPSKDKGRWWLKALVAFVAALPIAAPIIIGVVQYVWSARGEFKKKIWDEQYALYKPTCDAAAAVAVSTDVNDKVTAEHRSTFWNFYWGKLSILEHRVVKDAMVAYGQQLTYVENGHAKPASLKMLSYALARACRTSLRTTWNPADLEDTQDEFMIRIKEAEDAGAADRLTKLADVARDAAKRGDASAVLAGLNRYPAGKARDGIAIECARALDGLALRPGARAVVTLVDDQKVRNDAFVEFKLPY